MISVSFHPQSMIAVTEGLCRDGSPWIDLSDGGNSVSIHFLDLAEARRLHERIGEALETLELSTNDLAMRTATEEMMLDSDRPMG